MGQQFIAPNEILPGTLAYTNQYLLTGTTTGNTETDRTVLVPSDSYNSYTT